MLCLLPRRSSPPLLHPSFFPPLPSPPGGLIFLRLVTQPAPPRPAEIRAGAMDVLPSGVLDLLIAAARVDTNLQDPAHALAVCGAAVRLCALRDDVPLLGWVDAVIALLDTLEPGDQHCGELREALRTYSSVALEGSEGECGAHELVELAELADMADICGQTNRCAPRARDLVGRFFRKSIEQGAFFRDVRMTPANFDELVALATPHIPVSSRGPAAIPPQRRCFAVLFWLAQGGRQRVVARAVDVATSTFAKFCAPVVQAMLRGLPPLTWPDKSERKRIGLEFSRLTGGNLTGWHGMYVYFASLFLHFCFLLLSVGRDPLWFGRSSG